MKDWLNRLLSGVDATAEAKILLAVVSGISGIVLVFLSKQICISTPNLIALLSYSALLLGVDAYFNSNKNPTA